jgi:hypothetical protein
MEGWSQVCNLGQYANNYLIFMGYFCFGAQGRNRTTDTCIFSAVLYQLSYLGA